MLKFSVQSDIARVRAQIAGKDRQINLAASRAINRALDSARSAATKALSKSTGIKPQRAIRDKLRVSPADPNRLIGAIGVEAWTPNLIRFNARQTKRGVSASAWEKRKVYPRTFIGNKGRTVFKRVGKNRLPIKAVHGPRLHVESAKAEIRKAMDAVARPRFRKEFRREVMRRTGAIAGPS